MLQRKPDRVATVAAANRTARVAWAIMTRGGTYQAPLTTAALEQPRKEARSRGCEDDER